MADEGGREEASAREFGMPNSGGRSDDEMRGGGESRTFRGELDEGPVAEIDDAGRIRTIRLLRRRVTSEPLHGHGEDRRVARAKLRPRGGGLADCSLARIRRRNEAPAFPGCNHFGAHARSTTRAPSRTRSLLARVRNPSQSTPRHPTPSLSRQPTGTVPNLRGLVVACRSRSRAGIRLKSLKT